MSDLIRRAREALVDVTPGPWSHNTMGEFGPSSCEDDQSYGMICEPAGECDWPNAVDNARFIAAARDLVPAMADRLEAQEALLKEAKMALDALMEVTEPPERNCSCHINSPCGWCVEYEMVAIEHKRASATLAKLREHLGETE